MLASLMFTVAIATPKISSDDGNIKIVVEAGKEVGYSIGNSTVLFSDIPIAARDYADASFKLLTQGYDIGFRVGEAAGITQKLHELDSGIKWFDVQGLSRPDGQPSREIDTAGDRVTLEIRGFDLSRLQPALDGVAGSIVGCRFIKLGSDHIDVTTASSDEPGVIRCPSPAKMDGKCQLQLVYLGQPATTFPFVGPVGSDQLVPAAPTVLRYSIVGDASVNRAIPRIIGYAFDAASYTCEWAKGSNKWTLSANRISKNELFCDQFPAALAEAFVSDPDSSIDVLISGVKRNGVSLPAPAGALKFAYRDGLCVDGVKNGLEIHTDCGTTSGCGSCPPSSVAEGGECDSQADCKGELFCTAGKCISAMPYTSIKQLSNWKVAFSGKGLESGSQHRCEVTINGVKIVSPFATVKDDQLVCNFPDSHGALLDAKLDSKAYTADTNYVGPGTTYNGQISAKPTYPGEERGGVYIAVTASSCPQFNGHENAGWITTTTFDLVHKGGVKGLWLGSGARPKLCWRLPGYDLISPFRPYHSDRYRKYTHNFGKNSYDYGCDACGNARRNYDYNCKTGWSVFDYSYRSHCNHNNHKGRDSVFEMYKINGNRGVRFRQHGDNCGDPNEASWWVMCKKDGLTIPSPGSSVNGFFFPVRWSN